MAAETPARYGDRKIHFIAGVIQGGDLRAKVRLLNLLAERGIEVIQIQSGMAPAAGGGLLAPNGQPKIALVEIVTAALSIVRFDQLFGFPYDLRAAVEAAPAAVARWIEKESGGAV